MFGFIILAAFGLFLGCGAALGIRDLYKNGVIHAWLSRAVYDKNLDIALDKLLKTSRNRLERGFSRTDLFITVSDDFQVIETLRLLTDADRFIYIKPFNSPKDLIHGVELLEHSEGLPIPKWYKPNTRPSIDTLVELYIFQKDELSRVEKCKVLSTVR